MKKGMYFIIIIVCLLTLTGCKDDNEVENATTYTTEFANMYSEAYPTFEIEYPSDWQITRNDVAAGTLIQKNVIIESPSGVEFQYWNCNDYLGGHGRGLEKINISKVTKSAIDDFIVAKVEHTESLNEDNMTFEEIEGSVMYALLPKNFIGEHEVEAQADFLDPVTFDYAGKYAIVVTAPSQKKFTKDEEENAINILANIKCVSGSVEPEIGIEEPVLYKLQQGDFSIFAGTYKATSDANNGYGGGQDLSDLKLGKNGKIKGGNPSYSQDTYPTSKPIEVQKNFDGSYKCILTKNSYFTIYPKGTIESHISDSEKSAYLKDTVYINCVVLDGGVIDITYYMPEEKE